MLWTKKLKKSHTLPKLTKWKYQKEQKLSY